MQNISGAALVRTRGIGRSTVVADDFQFEYLCRTNKKARRWSGGQSIRSSPASALPDMVVKAPHPHAALLFLDYLHSKLGQQAAMKGGLSSARNDIGSLEQKFKKVYIESRYPPRSLEKKIRRMGRASCASCSSASADDRMSHHVPVLITGANGFIGSHATSAHGIPRS